jgi:hypothetical protein
VRGNEILPLPTGKEVSMKYRFRLIAGIFCLGLASGIMFSATALTQDYESGETNQDEEFSGDRDEEDEKDDDDPDDNLQTIEAAVQERGTIIALVEDDLSAAYSFDNQSQYPIPHFEKLDVLFPSWHHGEAAAARQFWLTLDFRAQLVQYRVDYIYKVNDFTAVVGGKRLVVWTRDEKASILEKDFWPFQYWANLTQHKNGKCVKCIDVTYAAVFEMRMTRDENGNWTIVAEKLTDQPGIPNNWEDDCAMEMFLRDWGFNSRCGTKKTSLFG